MIRGSCIGTGMVARVRIFFVALLLVFATSTVFAEPTPGPVNLLNICPYLGDPGQAGSSAVYITIAGANPPVCNTTVYVLEISQPGVKEAFSILVTALAAGRTVYLEIRNSTGCTGWGTKLQSVHLN